ncbi:MAG: APC family permease [Dehalococcoidia bacterium]|nr:APC family permease [Dehalococcoidia bacterium]
MNFEKRNGKRDRVAAKSPVGPRRSRAFRPLDSGVFRVSDEALFGVEGDVGRVLRNLRRTLFGVPLPSSQESAERLTKVKALAVLGSDNLSSSAYATEELIRVLALAGMGALAFTMPITLALVAVLAIVIMSYHHVIRAYPNGASSYIVSRENLGTYPALIAASALLIDYVLTVAVSIAAGIQALTSLFPGLYDTRIFIGMGAVLLLALGNLRGVRESGSIFALPTYLYLAGMLGFLGYGVFRAATGTLPEYTPPPDWMPATMEPLGLLLILRAFSSGAVALTGVEAISDGVPAFKRPEARNARITLTWMALLFGTLFVGLSYLSSHVGVLPDPSETETLVSQLVRAVVGPGIFHSYIQFTIVILLFLAANTAFADFPRLSSILAKDNFMPHQFSGRGERLAFSTGIIVLATLAAVCIFTFQGSVAALIPLYTVGVFAAFTLSQAGMVLHWMREHGKGWRTGLILNGAGALVTAFVMVEAMAVKFTHGAWVIALLVPLLVGMMISIRNHYRRLARELRLSRYEMLPNVKPTEQIVVVPVADLNKPFAQALTYARSLSPNVTGVHVSDNLETAEDFRLSWTQIVGNDTPLITIESPYRDFMGPLLAYIDDITKSSPDALVTVVIPEFVPKRWWEHSLHRQSAFRLKLALLSRPNIVVVDIPYQLKT